MEEQNLSKVRIVWSLFLVLLICVIFFWHFFFPPSNFPTDQKIEIPQGKTLHEISVLLKNEKVIKNPLVFDLYVRLSGKSLDLKAGTYKFDSPYLVTTIAKKIITGDYNIPLAKIVLPEGLRRSEVADIISDSLKNFSKSEFMTITKNKEGMIFPDTYFLTEDADTEAITKMIDENFQTKIKTVLEEISKSSYNLNQVLTLASIVEKEVAKPEDRKIVAGILENRLKAGIPLQVDAVFDYILNKNTYELTRADLKVDSPYNTYLYKGLPPGPIASPGLDAIEAVLHPTSSNYLYYVSDKSGNTYFAKTLKEHNKNVAKYF